MQRADAVWWPLYGVLLFVLAPATAPVTWIARNPSQESVPRHAIVAGKSGGVTFYVCRARLLGDFHPGATPGSLCCVPYRGKAQEFQEFEFATSPSYAWYPDRWQDAVIAGRQHGAYDLYVCRARVMRNLIDYGFIPGKAYRVGPHAHHCYVPFQGQELDFDRDFELLQNSPKTP